MYYVNANANNLKRIFDQNERDGYLRLDLNENPKGLPDEVLQEVLKKITPELVAKYPDTYTFSCILAEYLHIEIENLCLVNGSAEGIRYIIEAFTSPNGRIVGVVPSYFMFQIYSKMYDRNFVKVPYNDDLTMDIDKIIANLNSETQLLILLNPNNPMGNYYNVEEIHKLIKAANELQITVLIDEAYYYFHNKSFINYAINYEHVLITRTFSKFFSMAGARLGYVVGSKNNIKIIQNLCTPHNTNVFALKFAEFLITHPDLQSHLLCKFNEGRNFLFDYLKKYSYLYKGDAGNFIFIKPKSDAFILVERMKTVKSILIKAYPKIGYLGDCIRVTIGDKEVMQEFTNAMTELDK